MAIEGKVEKGGQQKREGGGQGGWRDVTPQMASLRWTWGCQRAAQNREREPSAPDDR